MLFPIFLLNIVNSRQDVFPFYSQYCLQQHFAKSFCMTFIYLFNANDPQRGFSHVCEVNICCIYYHHFYICFEILERAERLREIDSILLPAFIRLQELVRVNRLCDFVFTSNLLVDFLTTKYRPKGSSAL